MKVIRTNLTPLGQTGGLLTKATPGTDEKKEGLLRRFREKKKTETLSPDVNIDTKGKNIGKIPWPNIRGVPLGRRGEVSVRRRKSNLGYIILCQRALGSRSQGTKVREEPFGRTCS